MNIFTSSITSALHKATLIAMRRDVLLVAAAASMAMSYSTLNGSANKQAVSFSATSLPTSTEPAGASPSIAKTLLKHEGAYEAGNLAGATPVESTTAEGNGAATKAETASAEDSPAAPAPATPQSKTGA